MLKYDIPVHGRRLRIRHILLRLRIQNLGEPVDRNARLAHLRDHAPEPPDGRFTTRLRAFVTAIFPQVLPTYLSVSLFCLEGNVRYASILGYVGAGGLGLIMNEKIGWREYDSLGMILIVLFITVMIIEGVSHALRKRLT